jgi:hypothetical protein
MDIWQLKECLASIAHLDPPGADLVETMIRIAEAERWDVLKGWPDEQVQLWRHAYENDRDHFRETLKTLESDLYSGLLKNSLHRLGSVLTMRFEDGADLTPAEQMQRLADKDNTLLKTAFAYKLVDLNRTRSKSSFKARGSRCEGALLRRGRPLSRRGIPVLPFRIIYRLRRYVPLASGRGTRTKAALREKRIRYDAWGVAARNK